MSLSPAAVGTPQLLFPQSGSAPVGLPNPWTALSLAVSGSGSALSATTYYVQVDYTGTTGRSTPGSSQASVAVGTAGEDITTSVILPLGCTGVGVYVGTASNPLLLGTIGVSYSSGAWSVGTITYSGGATSGLAATVSGNTLSITISAAATSTGAAARTVNDATTLLYTAPANDTNVPAPAATTYLANIWVTNGDTANSHTVSLWVSPPSPTSTPGPQFALLYRTPIQAGDAVPDSVAAVYLPAGWLVLGAQDGGTITLPNGTSGVLPIGVILSGAVVQ